VVTNAPREVKVWGRGTGKSTHFAWKMHRIVQDMPRSASAIVGATYAQILTRTMPPVIEALERLGYHKDIDYLVGKKPPTDWGWEQPYQAPLSYERFIIFRNGAGFHLASQDREGKSRGLNIDYVLGDELLTLDRKKLEDEVFAANRGNLDRFGKKSLHHGFDMATSMPTNLKSQWILDYGNYYDEQGNDFWLIWNKLVKLQLSFIDGKSPTRMREIIREMTEMRRMLRFYKNKEGLLFSVSNVFDNIQNVGIDYIKQMRRQMSEMSFRVEVLNERINTIEECFYKLNEDIHTYDSYDYHYIDNLDNNFDRLASLDCRHDGDILRDHPLDISIDFGGVINAMVVGQEYSPAEYRYLKGLYVKEPDGISHLVNKFNEYYHHHNNKTVYFWYDHTAIGRYGGRETFVDETTRLLSALGWNVVLCSIGVTPRSEDRYLLWEIMLKGGDDRFPALRFNRPNCKELLMSMQLAPIKQSDKGFKKDKSSERSKVIVCSTGVQINPPPIVAPTGLDNSPRRTLQLNANDTTACPVIRL